MLLLFDASVLVAAHVGRGNGASAVVLSTVLLGGLEGCTVDNAIDEMANHLQSHYSGGRLKLSPARTARVVQRLAEAPTFTIHPWVTAPSEVLPENPKDAYLIEAIELHSPTCLVTLDGGLLALGSHGGAQIMTPKVLLEELLAIDP